MIGVEEERDALYSVVVVLLKPLFNEGEFFLAILDGDRNGVVGPVCLHLLHPFKLFYGCHVSGED